MTPQLIQTQWLTDTIQGQQIEQEKNTDRRGQEEDKISDKTRTQARGQTNLQTRRQTGKLTGDKQ